MSSSCPMKLLRCILWNGRTPTETHQSKRENGKRHHQLDNLIGGGCISRTQTRERPDFEMCMIFVFASFSQYSQGFLAVFPSAKSGILSRSSASSSWRLLHSGCVPSWVWSPPSPVSRWHPTATTTFGMISAPRRRYWHHHRRMQRIIWPCLAVASMFHRGGLSSPNRLVEKECQGPVQKPMQPPSGWKRLSWRA